MKIPFFLRSYAGFCVFVLAAVSAAPARADRHRGIPSQTYQPAHDSMGFLSLDAPEVLAPYSLSLVFGYDYAWAPMRLAFADPIADVNARALRFSNAFDFQSTLGLTRRLQLSLNLPFFRMGPGMAFNRSQDWGFTANDPLTTMRGNVPTSVPGDPALFLKVHLLSAGGFGAGLGVNLTLPFGVEEVFAGEEGVTVKPVLLLGFGSRSLQVLANVGYLWRREHTIARPTDETVTMLAAGPEVQGQVGLRWRMTPVFDVLVAFSRFVPLSDEKAIDAPTEALAGVTWKAKPDMHLTVFAGSGAGMNDDYGRGTDLRAGAQLVWTASEKVVERKTIDTDGDGIPDDEDQCPKLVEDKDNFEDDDGCPDPDNDQDGLADGQDKCTNEPEDEDAFADEDGCPDLDNDADGIPDAQDRCPNEKGTARFDGCPVRDRDADGIPDDQDKCPDEAGEASLAGCPDVGIRVNIVDGKVVPPGTIAFEGNTDKLAQASLPVLLELANQLKASPQIRLVRIEVHVAATRKPAEDLRLSNARAAAIRAFLISKGVSPVRVQGVGYGGKFPIKPNTTPENRAANTRVEFILVHQ